MYFKNKKKKKAQSILVSHDCVLHLCSLPHQPLEDGWMEIKVWVMQDIMYFRIDPAADLESVERVPPSVNWAEKKDPSSSPTSPPSPQLNHAAGFWLTVSAMRGRSHTLRHAFPIGFFPEVFCPHRTSKETEL